MYQHTPNTTTTTTPTTITTTTTTTITTITTTTPITTITTTTSGGSRLLKLRKGRGGIKVAEILKNVFENVFLLKVKLVASSILKVARALISHHSPQSDASARST